MDRQKAWLQINITLGILAQNKEHMSDLAKESWREMRVIFFFFTDRLLRSCCQVKFKDNEDGGERKLKSENKDKTWKDEKRQGREG